MKHQHLVGGLSLIALIMGSLCSSAAAVIFTPPPAQNAPRRSTGGASRGNLFTPSPSRSSPNQSSGGASRGTIFQPATGNGTPTQSAGGASRVGTYDLNPSVVSADGPAALIALLPQGYYGTTLSERPTILVYVPASTAKTAIFSLKDEAGTVLYQTTLTVAGKMGIMPIQLPANAPPLAIAKHYQWFLAFKVDDILSPSTPYVDGWIQRIQPQTEVIAALQQTDPLQQATTFGKHGIWYDCVATLASLRATHPHDPALATQWAELLASVGLRAIADMPILITAN